MNWSCSNFTSKFSILFYLMYLQTNAAVKTTTLVSFGSSERFQRGNLLVLSVSGKETDSGRADTLELFPVSKMILQVLISFSFKLHYMFVYMSRIYTNTKHGGEAQQGRHLDLFPERNERLRRVIGPTCASVRGSALTSHTVRLRSRMSWETLGEVERMLCDAQQGQTSRAWSLLAEWEQKCVYVKKKQKSLFSPLTRMQEMTSVPLKGSQPHFQARPRNPHACSYWHSHKWHGWRRLWVRPSRVERFWWNSPFPDTIQDLQTRTKTAWTNSNGVGAMKRSRDQSVFCPLRH